MEERPEVQGRGQTGAMVLGSREQTPEAKFYMSWKSGSGPRLTTCISGNLTHSPILSRQPWYAKWPSPMTSPPPTLCECPKHKMVIEPRLCTCCPLMASLPTYYWSQLGHVFSKTSLPERPGSGTLQTWHLAAPIQTWDSVVWKGADLWVGDYES